MFDTVSWDFMDKLFDSLASESNGEGALTYWSTARFSIIINGKPEDFFSQDLGTLTRGSPLSSSLFFGSGYSYYMRD